MKHILKYILAFASFYLCFSSSAGNDYHKKIADSTSTEAILPDNANLKTINAPDETKK
jgi:hypothetical protein